jgi:hypothetical protein
VTGSYPTYLAGILPSFDWIMGFVALKDHPLLNFIFQRGSVLVQVFGIGRFLFTLVRTKTIWISVDTASGGMISKGTSSL